MDFSTAKRYFLKVFSANKGPKWALEVDPRSFSEFLCKITVA